MFRLIGGPTIIAQTLRTPGAHSVQIVLRPGANAKVSSLLRMVLTGVSETPSDYACACTYHFSVSKLRMCYSFRIRRCPRSLLHRVRAGLVVGKKFRFVEWDLGISPKEPNGDMIAVQVRTGTITRQGMREAICKAYDLPNTKVVKQFAHVVELHHRTFYEHMDTRESLQNLDEGAVIVWTQVRQSMCERPTGPAASEQNSCCELGLQSMIDAYSFITS